MANRSITGTGTVQNTGNQAVTCNVRMIVSQTDPFGAPVNSTSNSASVTPAPGASQSLSISASLFVLSGNFLDIFMYLDITSPVSLPNIDVRTFAYGPEP